MGSSVVRDPEIDNSRRCKESAAATGRPMAAGVRVQRCRAQTQVAKALSAPAGYKTYESMMVLRPDLMEEERDAQLAKVESILAENGAIDIKLVTKGIQRIAYPIDGMWEGFMVFMTYMTP